MVNGFLASRGFVLPVLIGSTMGRSEHGKGEEIHNNPPFSSFNNIEKKTNKKVKVKAEKVRV